MVAIEVKSPAVENPRRKRNPRGEGERLREEIIAGAAAVLGRTGSEEAVSLRAIAREVGIAAPSISRHFADRTEIIDEVIARTQFHLHDSMYAAGRSTDDPVEQLQRIARAYLAFARDHPVQYRLLMSRRYVEDWETRSLTMPLTQPAMLAAIDAVVAVLQACIDTGASASTDARADTLIMWGALHGLVTAPQAITSVDWPDDEQLVEACVTRMGRLVPPGAVERPGLG